MERRQNNIDAIVVGAGPAGISAALTIKRGGRNVVVLERAANFGSKNMFGGAVYLNSIKSILPETYQNAPYERFIVNHSYSFLNDKGSIDIKAQDFEDKTTATVLRPKFDSWLVDEAKKEGVFFAPKTLVKKLIFKNGTVIGVKTEQEKYFAPIVIIADGANSLLAREIGLRSEYFPKDMVLSVKETMKLDKNIMEERFHLDKNSKDGAMYEFFGGLTDFYGADILDTAGENSINDAGGGVKGSVNGGAGGGAKFCLNKKGKKQITPFAISFLYTFNDMISLGLGVSLEDLSQYKINPNDLLEKLKSHPSVKNLIKDAETCEYSAHLIPEGGYNNLPKLYASGVMVIGDAAGLINSAHFEGTNFAIESGKLAGETAIIALNLDNYKYNILKIYEEKLRRSFILKDLKSYRNVVETIYSRKNSLLKYYPDKMGEFFHTLHCVDNKPKKAKFRAFAGKFFAQRSVIEMFRDIKAALRLFFDIIC